MFNIDSDTMNLLIWFLNSAKIPACGLDDAEKISALKKGLEVVLQAAQKAQQPVSVPAPAVPVAAQ